MSVVELFAYRLPRFDVALPVEFCCQAGNIAGQTRNVSDTGLLVRLTEPVIDGTAGIVRLRLGTCTLEIESRVTHSEFLAAGISFVFSSDQQRQFIRTLVKVLAKTVR